MLVMSILIITLIVAWGTVVWAFRQYCKIKKHGKETNGELVKANQVMHDYERDVFGWWGGDKEKADAMTAPEIQRKWKEHQKKLRDLGVF